MSNRPELLSIIVPVYNEVRTVRAVIDRLLAIDLPVAREILVVDDGSTDGTREALAALGTRDSGLGIRADPESLDPDPDPGARIPNPASSSSTPSATRARAPPSASA